MCDGHSFASMLHKYASTVCFIKKPDENSSFGSNLTLSVTFSVWQVSTSSRRLVID